MSAPKDFRITALIVASAMFMETLDSTVLSTALPTMAKAFNIHPLHMSLALTSYLLSLAVFIPISGKVADRFGAKKVFSIAIALFTVSSVFCANADSITLLIIARFVQGIGGAMMVPVGRLVLLKSVAKKDMVSALAWQVIPGLIGPIVGPVLGGFIVTYFSWHWIFYINVPIGIIGILLVQRFIADIRETKCDKIDFKGFVLSGIALACLVFGLEVVTRNFVWIKIAIPLIVVGIFCCALYIRHAQNHDCPILDLRLMKIKTFGLSVLAGSLTRIEGGKLTDREVEKLLSNLEIKKFANRDEQEVAGYAETMETVYTSWQDIPITENHIKQLHRDLLKHSDKDERHRGEYKAIRNDVGAFDANGKMIGVVFETATPFDTPYRMAELVNWLNQARELKNLHPLLIVAIFTVVFLEIHPFQDGNGRLSRILTTLLLLQDGYIYVPYASLESVIENSKEGYYLALRQTQKTIRTDNPDWLSWLLFFMKAMQQQKRNLAIKVEKEKLMLSNLPELSVNIIDHIRQHGRATIGDIILITGASRNTLKEHFKRLLEQGHIAKHGTGKGTWYTLP